MTYAFDTLKFTQRLEQVGVGRDQAVAHAELARDMILADTATKADLAALETALKAEITGVRTDTRADVSNLRTDIQTMKREFEGSLRELELRITVKLGAIIAAAVAAIAALQKFL